MTKIETILLALMKPCGLNRFEAERLGDHCLNSTVAVLRAQQHIIAGEWENVPTRFSTTARVLRYRWISGPSNVNPFAELLGEAPA